MNFQNIVTSSLTQLLIAFQEAIAPLLELGKIEDWDGTELKKREEKVRKLVIILAGKCITILLLKLSKCYEAQAIALEQTKGWWRKRTRKNGSREWTILTMGNVKVTLKLPYVVERLPKPRKKKKPPLQGFCPFLRWLGLEKRVTPLVWSTIAEYGTMRTSFETAQGTLKDWGIEVSIRRIQSLTYSFCQAALSQRRSKIFHLREGDLEKKNALKDKRVVISVDGGRSRIIEYKGKKRNPKTHRLSYKGEWKEPKLLTIYAVDEKGKKIKTGEVPITNDGTFGDSKDFLVILEMYLVELGINQAKQILFIADGSEWMWKEIPPLLQNSEALESEIKHLVKLQKVGRINYPLIAQKKLPLGSGAIESLIRQAVNLRLKGNGKFWRRHNAEALLHARCQWLGGRWDELVESILTHRIYPALE